METREARDGYTIFALASDQSRGFVVREGDSYLCDGRLIYHVDYDGGAYPSLDIARSAILAYQGDASPAAGPSYPANQWPGHGKNWRHFRIMPWEPGPWNPGHPSQWPSRTLAAAARKIEG